MYKHFSPAAAEPGASPPSRVTLASSCLCNPSRLHCAASASRTRTKGTGFASDSSRDSFLLFNKQKLPRTGNTSHSCQKKNKDVSQMPASRTGRIPLLGSSAQTRSAEGIGQRHSEQPGPAGRVLLIAQGSGPSKPLPTQPFHNSVTTVSPDNKARVSDSHRVPARTELPIFPGSQ